MSVANSSSGFHCQRKRLEPLGVEQSLDVAAHRLAQHAAGDDDAARLEFGSLPHLEIQPMNALLLVVGQACVGIDRADASGREQFHTLRPELLFQGLVQSVDLRAYARQIVDEAVPERRLDRLSSCSRGTA